MAGSYLRVVSLPEQPNVAGVRVVGANRNKAGGGQSSLRAREKHL